MNNNIANLTNNLVNQNNQAPTVNLNQMPGLVQTGTSYSTAMQVIKERNLTQVTNKCLVEASLAGDDFYYSWSQGGSIIEGLTVGAALAIVRNFGNCNVDVKIEETHDAYIFHGVFIDLETGFNLSRPFRQNKQSPKSRSGKDIYTGDRGKDIIFQIGASKAIRNVVLNACPSWLTNKVIQKAKENVFQKIEAMGTVKALDYITKKAKALKIPMERIERTYGKSSKWDNEKFVMVSGAIKSIEDGFETVDSIFQNGLNEAANKQLEKNQNTTKTHETKQQNNQTINTQPFNKMEDYYGDIVDEAVEQGLFNNPGTDSLPNS